MRKFIALYYNNGGHQEAPPPMTVTDRAGAEVKELIGGYYIIHAADFDGAEAIAADFPDYDLDGTVEIREVMVFN